MVKRKDVAKLAGVSEATVSRVFNNVAPLRKKTIQKVRQAAEELGYRPNAIAQSFATGKARNIGVVVPHVPKVNVFSTHYFSELLSGIGAKLGEVGYGLLLLFQPADAPKDYTELFLTQKIDGCIILGSKRTSGEIEALQKLHDFDFPYCLVNQTYPEYPFRFIDANHYEGSYQAVTLLIQKGFEKVLFLNGPMEYSNSADRLAGYQNALSKAGIRYVSEWIFEGNYSRKSGFQAAEKMGEFITDYPAVFAGNDRMAIGLIQGLSQQGYQAGKDYALIGYDDSDVSKMTTPSLSTVKVPLFDMGYLAAKRVLEQISSDEVGEIRDRLSVSVIERESSNLKPEKVRKPLGKY